MTLYIIQFYDPICSQQKQAYELDVLTEDSYQEWIDYAKKHNLNNYQVVTQVQLAEEETSKIHNSIKERISRHTKLWRKSR